ncbi:serine acetyltransferase [Eubacterium sp. AM05-23]|uniref:Serine acetyltransferase n=2 Tax=Eubacterium TaxID=1730 RepID=A0A4P9C6T1_EUBML|nr:MULTISPECIES: serine O-acetyltransferase [Eubacterium]QCT71199.1 serine acetyltransferase [Eubacterium maltosivorans]RHO59897.1 serine acetyltransferase [Eubacterium sp. AM05-23]
MDPVYAFYKIARFMWKHHISFMAFFFRGLMRVIFACDIPYKTQIGTGTVFPHHALGIVIHQDAVIGKNCIIEQNVTIGGRSGFATLPKIGNNIMVGAGASIIGPVIIGDNVQIGAGAVVVHDIPDNCVVIGVPAKIIKKDGVKI